MSLINEFVFLAENRTIANVFLGYVTKFIISKYILYYILIIRRYIITTLQIEIK